MNAHKPQGIEFIEVWKVHRCKNIHEILKRQYCLTAISQKEKSQNMFHKNKKSIKVWKIIIVKTTTKHLRLMVLFS